jgi:hypothetical protein
MSIVDDAASIFECKVGDSRILWKGGSGLAGGRGGEGDELRGWSRGLGRRAARV